MTDGSRELWLTIINDGSEYARRCDIATKAYAGAGDPYAVRAAARAWLGVVLDGVRKYEKEFGSPHASCFTAEDLCLAAGELAEYYERHILEKLNPANVKATGPYLVTGVDPDENRR